MGLRIFVVGQDVVQLSFELELSLEKVDGGS
jgi:hypothetical protein